MRSLLLAGVVLAALSTSASAWTQSLLHPESRESAIATAKPAPPHLPGHDEVHRRAKALRMPHETVGATGPARASDPLAWRSCPWC